MDGEGSGITFFGEKGSLFTGGNDYTIYDLDGKTVRQVKAGEKVNAQNTANPSPDLDTLHIANFLESIRDNKLPSADAEIGHKSTLLVQLGNIAWRTQRLLHIDPANGHIASDAQAQKLWGRDYEKGWEPVV
jgi:predicted dehydrogenase